MTTYPPLPLFRAGPSRSSAELPLVTSLLLLVRDTNVKSPLVVGPRPEKLSGNVFKLFYSCKREIWQEAVISLLASRTRLGGCIIGHQVDSEWVVSRTKANLCQHIR